MDEEVLSGAVNAIRHADTLIIGGTSLVVYPAAGDVYKRQEVNIPGCAGSGMAM